MITTVTFTTWHSWMSLRWRQLQLLSVALSGWRAKGVKTSQMTLKAFCRRSDQLYMKSYTYCWSVGLFLPKLGCIMRHIWFGDSQNFICSRWEHHPCDSTARGVSIRDQSQIFLFLSTCFPFIMLQKSTKKSKPPSYRTQTQPRLPFLGSIKTFF